MAHTRFSTTNRSVTGGGWRHTAATPLVDHGEQRPQSSQRDEAEWRLLAQRAHGRSAAFIAVRSGGYTVQAIMPRRNRERESLFATKIKSHPAFTPHAAAAHHRTLAGTHFPSHRGEEAELAELDPIPSLLQSYQSTSTNYHLFCPHNDAMMLQQSFLCLLFVFVSDPRHDLLLATCTYQLSRSTNSDVSWRAKRSRDVWRKQDGRRRVVAERTDC